jgi:trigger factor
MKRLRRVSLILAGAMCLSLLGGCGKSSDNPAEVLKDKYSQYVELGEYKGVSYTPTHTEVTDSDIQSEIDSLVSQCTTTEEQTSGVATMGDAVNIDYVGSVDGVEFDGGSTEGNGTQITLGEAGYIDDFEEQIAGHEVGETFDVNVTFPDSYGNEDLAGKDAVFVTTLNSIIITNVPEYNDELVAANTDYSTTDEFEQAMYESYEESNAASDENTDRQNVFDTILANSTVTAYPEQEMQELIDETVDQIEEAAESNSIDVSTYIMYWYGFSSEDEFIAEVEDNVKSYLEEKMIVAAVAKAENITVTKDDADEKTQQILSSYGYTDVADLEDYFTEEDYYYYALAEKVLDFLMDNAVVASATDATAE